MKTYCKGHVVTRELVSRAYEEWRKGVSGKKNGWRVEDEYGSADALIDEVWEEIAERRLAFRPIRRYVHHERTNGKTRIIGVESVKQQVCDYVAVIALRPLLDARLGFYQCAGVPGKGQSLCRSAIRKWSHEGGYFIKADVRKCYPSLSPDVVRRILGKYVRSAEVLYLCDALMGTYAEGMEIGSYFSLCVVNLALSFAYHHVEGLGKTRRGKRVPLVRHQVWHLDDMLLCGRDKRDLRRAMRSLERYMRDELGLTLKPWKVARMGAVERPDMGGFCAIDGHVLLRGRIFLRGTRAFARYAKRPTVRGARAVCSYWGWFRHASLGACMARRGMGATFGRARRHVRAYDRLERYGTTHAVSDTA